MVEETKRRSTKRRRGKRSRAIRLKYSDRGLANNFGDYIEINQNLQKYPDLLEYVIDHEKKHIEGFDLSHEFKIKPLKVLKLILFCLRYPKSLIDLFPIQKREGIIYYDLNLICLYFLLAVLIYLITLIY